MMLCDVQVDQMIETIKNVVKSTLQVSHWMDEQTRAAAIDKVDCEFITLNHWFLYALFLNIAVNDPLTMYFVYVPPSGIFRLLNDWKNVEQKFTSSSSNDLSVLWSLGVCVGSEN